MTKHILIIKDFFPSIKDPRLIKINLMLSTKYKVSLLGWDREFTKRKCLKDEKIPILHLRTIYLGFQRALLFPWWWLFIIYVLIKYNYDAVHVINLPSLLPSILICKIKKKKIIYDIEDSYIDQNELPNIIRTMGLNFEKFLTKFCDGVVLVDEIQQKEYGKILSKNIEIVYDSPPDIYYNEQIKSNNNIFTFF